MNTQQKQEISKLYERHFGEDPGSFTMLPPSGSYREYARVQNSHHSAIGVFNADIRENRAFFAITRQFRGKGIPVPEIYSVSADLQKYLIEDLGDITLFDFLTGIREREGFSERIEREYRKVLKVLPRIQVEGEKGFDFSVCYPREAFDKQSMLWDLNYFKYYFLKLARVPFDEQALEDDFRVFSDYLLSAPSAYFMYRDFQSRNVMLKDDDVYFIDYQGGRRGPLQYDLASLLFDGKADIPPAVRTRLYHYYLSELKKYLPVAEEEFTTWFNGFVLIRILQAMGAYGFRGFYEKKTHFLKSIPYALKNLEMLLPALSLPVKLPELFNVLQVLGKSDILREIVPEEKKLTVRITSFSYKKGIPGDPSGNGGGFVFDCRALNNPGRYAEYKNFTGKDQRVIDFIEQDPQTAIFLQAVQSLTTQTVKNYLERGFTHLSVSFGCTGGQHRSVFAAEKLADHLRNNYPVNVVLIHREQEL